MNRSHHDPREADSVEDAPEVSVAWAALSRSRWALDPRRWDCVVVVVEGTDAPRVELRAELAEKLRAADLQALAHAVALRRVPPGAVLLFALRDDEGGAGVLLDFVRLVEKRGGAKRR